jgi:hypothetical protein
MPSTLSINTVNSDNVFSDNPSQNAILVSSEIANLIKNPNFSTLFSDSSIPREKLKPLRATNLESYTLSGFHPTQPGQIAFKTITSFNLANNAVGGLQGGVPVGTVVVYYGKPSVEGGSIPEGYLLCDGRFVMVAEYPSLFAALGYRFGDDGVLKFRLPTATSPLSSVSIIKY